MSEFADHLKTISLEHSTSDDDDVHDDPLAWQLVKTVFGLLVLNDSSVDDVTVRDGLNLRRNALQFVVQKFDTETQLWDRLGVYEEGEFSWDHQNDGHGGEIAITSTVSVPCSWCTCENGLWQDPVGWRMDSWVTALATLAGLGIVCCLVVLVFLCSQCGQVLEGGQTTAFLLLAATALTFGAMLPYCFEPGHVDCILRTSAPACALT